MCNQAAHATMQVRKLDYEKMLCVTNRVTPTMFML